MDSSLRIALPVTRLGKPCYALTGCKEIKLLSRVVQDLTSFGKMKEVQVKKR